tara:strand:+ start:2400 stop:2939 length:540 start_codon:yes stop_codon:yes gene_type:complete
MKENTESEQPMMKTKKETEPMHYYVVQTKKKKEREVIRAIRARLQMTGSCEDIRKAFGIMFKMSECYVCVQSTSEQALQKVMGRIGSHSYIPPLKWTAARWFLGEITDAEADEARKPKNPLEGLEIGTIVEVTKGAWRGHRGIIRRMDERKRELTISLHEMSINMDIDVHAKHAREVVA